MYLQRVTDSFLHSLETRCAFRNEAEQPPVLLTPKLNCTHQKGMQTQQASVAYHRKKVSKPESMVPKIKNLTYKM